jgi:cell division protein FtsZ
MLFIAAGMGKGTGTGGSPVIAQLAREMGILTVAIVTKPFSMLGKSAMRKADEGVEKLKENVDALIVVANDKIIDIYGNLKGSEAFAMADDILTNAAKGIAEIITGAGIHNTDFNDVRNVLSNGGSTIMGIGYAKGDNRAQSAVKNALESPLLSEYNIVGAQKALVNISYSEDHECTLSEIGEIIEAVHGAARNEIEIIHGTGIDNTLEEELAVTIVVTGFKAPKTEKSDVPLQEIVSIEREENSTNPESFIEVDNERQIVINFGGVNEYAEESIQNPFSDSLEVDETVDIQISEADTSFFDELGRVVEESDEDKRRRMLSQLSFDVTSPLNSTDHLEMGIDPIKSNVLVSDKNNLFRENNRFDPKID